MLGLQRPSSLTRVVGVSAADESNRLALAAMVNLIVRMNMKEPIVLDAEAKALHTTRVRGGGAAWQTIFLGRVLLA